MMLLLIVQVTFVVLSVEIDHWVFLGLQTALRFIELILLCTIYVFLGRYIPNHPPGNPGYFGILRGDEPLAPLSTKQTKNTVRTRVVDDIQ